MPDIIQLLPDAVANQIAAGEVVQRPASVVKELLENAVDAGASSIQLIIKDAGKSLIQIIDNGIGMSETDARMSLERHATSKLRKAEDLFELKTMGFRGEAMASIAAVSQMEIKTRQEGSELGVLIQVEASEIKKQEPIACEQGTSTCVKNLFYNIPARRNFLKSNGVEMRHIIDEFQRVALSNPDIRLSFFQNDMEIYKLPEGKLSQRIVNIYGKNYQGQLAACKEDTSHLRVHGYIGKPEFAKKTRGEQFFFVNQRFIKSNYLNHAVLNAFEGLLPSGSYPFYVLFIDLDPKHIDINVHPTKTEIKFEDERTVYGIVRAAVKQALGAHNITPAIDFDHDVNFATPHSLRVSSNTAHAKDNAYSQFKSTPLQKANLDNWEGMYEGLPTKEFGSDTEAIEKKEESTSLIFQSAANTNDTKEQEGGGDRPNEGGVTFQVHLRYIVTQVKSGLMMIDQQAAHERILYEKYLGHLENKAGASQQCLFPQTVELSLSDFALVRELKEEITALGFAFEVFGKYSIAINGIPTDVISGNEKTLFEGLIEQFKKNKNELTLSTRENLARSLAKRSSIKEGKRLSPEEMNALIGNLFACKNANYSPGGQLTTFLLDLNRISSYFNQ